MLSTTTAVTADQHDQKSSSPMTSRIAAPSYRLLYRGSLALPDSEVQLDGIIFVMSIAFKSPLNLITSPIPLGLESMRGRPLRLVSTMDITNTYIECTGDLSMYIHPDAFLTHSFFERTLCTSHHALIPEGNQMRTSVAVRIGQGDGLGPDESDILVFGQLDTPTFPYPQDSSSSIPVLKLLVGRIAPPAAPITPPRAPRPDDPLPRSHPLANLHLSPGRRGMKRKRSSLTNPFGIQQAASSTNSPSSIATPDGQSGSGQGQGSAGSALMAALAEAQAQAERKKKSGKVVMDPSEMEQKGLSRRPTLFRVPSKGKNTPGTTVDRDGFLVPGLPVHALVARKGKDKDKDVEQKATKTPEKGAVNESIESELEVKNKTAIKKRALSALEACGISKTHAEFRDMYGWIHRGVGFAVRNVIRDTKVDRDLITKLVEMHLEMYFGGRGGKFAIAADTSANANTNISEPSTSQSIQAPPLAAAAPLVEAMPLEEDAREELDVSSILSSS